jgi:carboxylesterase type B
LELISSTLLSLPLDNSFDHVARVDSCSYRLGVFGFLHSEELSYHGYSQNNALLDQRTALLWIKKYIGGFGGDPLNITVVGESAGGGM